MILTCPECATGYFVDDAEVGPEGRKVRCAACGARWTATPTPTPLDLGPTQESAIDKHEATADSESAPLTADDLPRAFRSKAEEERRLRLAAVNGAAWAALGLAIVLLIGGGVVFRESVVRAWPQTASAYSAIGLPVNPIGLKIEDVQAEPSLQQGHAVLAVSGVIRNVVDRVVVAPPLRITLLNAQGKRVAGQIDALANARIPPGETRHFMAAVFDPPFSAHDLVVDFAMGARPDTVAQRQGAPATPAPPLALRGPAELEPSFSNAAEPASPATTVPATNATAATS